jgi:hypothetical protein
MQIDRDDGGTRRVRLVQEVTSLSRGAAHVRRREGCYPKTNQRATNTRGLVGTFVATSPSGRGGFMKAEVFHEVGDIRLDDVAEPKIEQPTDAIVRLNH